MAIHHPVSPCRHFQVVSVEAGKAIDPAAADCVHRRTDPGPVTTLPVRVGLFHRAVTYPWTDRCWSFVANQRQHFLILLPHNKPTPPTPAGHHSLSRMLPRRARHRPTSTWMVVTLSPTPTGDHRSVYSLDCLTQYVRYSVGRPSPHVFGRLEPTRREWPLH